MSAGIKSISSELYKSETGVSYAKLKPIIVFGYLIKYSELLLMSNTIHICDFG